mmetsp:Transcript_3096/g.4180  ORF Transcript_3096/g.4180 Transcript_3096/m.4180 type:complete len:313 (-) Transcript_3096:210-1148(-)
MDGNKQKDEIKPADEEEDSFCTPPIYYFGFGAMANPISRRRRSVVSRDEHAALLKDHKLTFSGGYATVRPCPGEHVHGVVMELTKAGWDSVTKAETGYNVIQGKVFPYKNGNEQEQETPLVANLFRLPEHLEHDPDSEHGKLSLPTERYLKVIATGMREHGVKEDYIKNMILGVDFVPSTKPDQYQYFQTRGDQAITSLPTFSWTEYQTICNEKQAFVMGNRCLVFEEKVEHAEALGIRRWMEANLFGKGDCTWTIWTVFLESDLPICEQKEHMTEIHKQWAENHLIECFLKTNIQLPKAYGILKPENILLQ